MEWEKEQNYLYFFPLQLKKVIERAWISIHNNTINMQKFIIQNITITTKIKWNSSSFKAHIHILLLPPFFLKLLKTKQDYRLFTVQDKHIYSTFWLQLLCKIDMSVVFLFSLFFQYNLVDFFAQSPNSQRWIEKSPCWPDQCVIIWF